MTREENICQSCAHSKVCKSNDGESSEYCNQYLALSALRPVSRERVEKMAAEWVQDINRGPAIFYCSSCRESFEIHSYEFQKYRFCPFCMAPMTDEAEDLMLKRLEALHETD